MLPLEGEQISVKDGNPKEDFIPRAPDGKDIDPSGSCLRGPVEVATPSHLFQVVILHTFDLIEDAEMNRRLVRMIRQSSSAVHPTSTDSKEQRMKRTGSAMVSGTSSASGSLPLA